jgi:predicted dehydrogenase
MNPVRIAIIGNTSSNAQYIAAAKRVRYVEIDFHSDAARVASSIADDVDAVIFTNGQSPPRLIQSLIERQKHIMMTTTEWNDESVCQLSKLARQNETVLLPDRVWRFRPDAMTMKEQLDNGKLGAAGLLRIHRWSSNNANRSSDCLYWDVDLACWLFDSEPNALYAMQRQSTETALPTKTVPPKTPPQYLQIHLGFPNGGSAVIDHCYGLPAGEEYQSTTLIGSSGAIYADDHRDRQLLFRGDGVRAPKSDDSLVALTAQLQSFVESCRNVGGIEFVDDEVTRVWRVLDQVEESMNKRAAVVPEISL